jgi:tetratricopeptide (TPR) repeat protein
VILLLTGCDGGGKPDSVGSTPPLTYVGSAQCEECHAAIYADWKTTLHSFSVRSAKSAARAAYPLPPAGPGPLADWQNISYVFGGRQRIAYMNTQGDLIQPSYDVRLDHWDKRFPTANISSCGACHFTGKIDAAGTFQDYDPQAHWTELAIGCEACHGPASLHVETFDKRDIEVDSSSSACGDCHTEVNRALPASDAHTTHDSVQAWHRDSHTRGMSQHSMSAQCATCHDPGNGTHGPYDDPSRIVFMESKTAMSCTSCHNPHRSTSPEHPRDTVPTEPPAISLLQRHGGRDGDFTSSDYTAHDDTESQCRSCHRGADRIVLDHGNATCVDCHNPFNRSRSGESLVLHDANNPALNCRTCHIDADHLITLLYQDSVFGEPRLIHDLKALPPAAIEKHGLGRGGLSQAAALSSQVQEVADSSQLKLHTLAEPGQFSDRTDVVAGYLTAATNALANAEPERIRKALTSLCALDSSDVLLSLGVLPHHPVTELSRIEQEIESLQLAELEINTELSACVQALAAKKSQQPDVVLRAVRSVSSNARGNLLVALGALAHLERRDARSAFMLLQTKLEEGKTHPLLLSVAAIAQARRNRQNEAIAMLLQAHEDNPDDSVAWFVHGRIAADAGDFADAARAYLRAAQTKPDWPNAVLQLGRSLIYLQQVDDAVAVLEHASKTWPTSFDTRYRLGSLYKLLADQLRHQISRASENRPPTDFRYGDWQLTLSAYEERAHAIAERAYGEYAYALAQRPGDQRTVWQVAEILRLLGRYPEAQELFVSLSTRYPTEWLYPYRAAVVNIAQDRMDEAIELLDIARRRRPDQADVLGASGFSLLKMGHPTEASVQFEKANAFEPFNPAVFNNLGIARARLDDFAGAERAFRRGLELRTFPLPRTHLLYTNLALVLARDGRITAAIAAAQQALYVFPDYAPASQLLTELNSGTTISIEFQLNDQLELFGELSTVSPLDLTL